VPAGKKIEHQGIKVELVGQVGMFSAETLLNLIELEYLSDKSLHPFTSLTRELEIAGTLTEDKTFDYEFAKMEKEFDTYDGAHARLRYFVRVKIIRGYGGTVTKEMDFKVENYNDPPTENNPIKMEVGIEDCLHIEFNYAKEKYWMDDVILGTIDFRLVRIKIKYMELQLIRRETTGAGKDVLVDNDVCAKFEIMDGAPVRGESGFSSLLDSVGELVPIRLYLSPIKLHPSLTNVHNKFSVKHMLNLVLVDEEERRYFKQHEIQIMRKNPETA
jgi:hypothetical protein